MQSAAPSAFPPKASSRRGSGQLARRRQVAVGGTGPLRATQESHEFDRRDHNLDVVTLGNGDAWLDQGANILCFGPSGTGKSHAAAAIGHALAEGGRRVLFTRTTDLVQTLQAARRDLSLPAMLTRLDRFDCLILDDLGYASKDQAETSVLFELIAERYERRSLIVTCNQPFSEWNRIFPDAAMTVAAIDRLVRHTTILELNAESYRRRAAAAATPIENAAYLTSMVVAARTARHYRHMVDLDDIIVRIEVHIVGIQPSVARTLELPLDLNLAQLHEVLQASFGWTDSHLHQFNIGGLTYGAPEFDDDGLSDRQTFEASDVRLADFDIHYDAPILVLYEYDFGDSWTHALELTRAPREAGVKYPRCIAGTRSGPPEDVGGTSGYEDFLEAWRDPEHEEHNAMRRWAGRKYDPERFDLDANNKAIARAIRRSKGSYRFRHER